MRRNQHILYILFLLTLIACNGKEQETEHVSNNIEPAVTTADTSVAEKPELARTVVDSAFLIVPGKQVGKVALGMTTEKVISLIGKPDSGDAAMGKALSFWISNSKRRSYHYLAIFSSLSRDEMPQHVVRQIQVTSPRFHTPANLSTGDPIAAIRSKLSVLPVAYYLTDDQEKVYIFDDAANGIAFEVSAIDSLCTAITVHEPGKTVQQAYLPIHPDLVQL